jgi:hypothetical protein
MNEALQVLTSAAHIGCFGQFSPGDRICRSRCALRLRCAVASAEHRRQMLLEALEAEEDLFDF